MFEALPGSRPAPAGRLRGTAFSALTHGALITLALTSTRGTSPYAHGTHDIVPAEHVEYLKTLLFTHVAKSATVKKEAASVKKLHKAAKDTWALHVDSVGGPASMPIDVPDVHLDTMVQAQMNDWLSKADALSADTASRTLAQSVGALIDHPLAGGVYTPDMVDRIVAPRPGNPTPRYPQVLMSAGIEQTLDVTFVVDTTGRVEEPSIAFPSTAHRLFAESVRAALLASRYFPAYLGGRVVPQLVQQQFRFVLR